MAFHLLKNAITIFCYTKITQLFDITYYVSLHKYQYIHPSALGIPNFKYFQSMSSISFSLVSLGFLVVQLLFCSIFFHLLQILIPSFARQLLFYRRPNEIKNPSSHEIGFPILFALNLKPLMRLKILSHTR